MREQPTFCMILLLNTKINCSEILEKVLWGYFFYHGWKYLFKPESKSTSYHNKKILYFGPNHSLNQLPCWYEKILHMGDTDYLDKCG